MFGEGEYEYDEPLEKEPPISFLLTLLTMLDFENPGQVTREDWERGVNSLYCPGLSHEVGWAQLLRRFDRDHSGAIEFGETAGLAPLDPRVGTLMRVVVQTLVRMSERINSAHADIRGTKLKMMKNTINQWSNKLLHTVFSAWRDDVARDRQRRESVIANLRYAPCRKCLHAMSGMIRQRKAAMSRAANMMSSGETRLKQIVITAWRDAHRNGAEEKNKKLMMFFMGREEWWRMHVVDTWKAWSRHERKVRKFLISWRYAGMAKTYIAWKRHTRATVDERNAGLARGMAMFRGGTQYKCYLAWAGAAKSAREERDALLRGQLLKKGALFGVRVAKAWFDWHKETFAKKQAVRWRCTLAGKAFRSWLRLMDTKRRREFLEWALGPNMSVLTGKLKAATADLQQDIDTRFNEVRESVGGSERRLRQEARDKHKELAEAINHKIEISDVEPTREELARAQKEIAALKGQLTEQAARQLGLVEESERGVSKLGRDLDSLQMELGERVERAERALDERADHEDAQLGAVQGQLREVQRSKASHAELMALVAKLQHRPKPGQPVAVQQLLAVPYPMPPGPSITSPRRGRPTSAAAARVIRPTATRPESQLREVPTAAPEGASGEQRPHLATSEQILVRPLPADALPVVSEQKPTPVVSRPMLAPPSSHTPSLSSRALSTRRPLSAREGKPKGPLLSFEQKTERLMRSLAVEDDMRVTSVEPARPGLS